MAKNYYVAFISERTKKAYEELRQGKYEDTKLYESINQAIDHLKEDYAYGLRVPHKLIPKGYVKRYGVDNIRKINLQQGWRILYTVKADRVMIVSVILEWLDHKNYERRFKY